MATSTNTPPSRPHLPRLLTAQDLADQFGEPKARIYALAREHGLPHIRLGRAMRFDAGAVSRWLERGGTAATPGSASNAA